MARSLPLPKGHPGVTNVGQSFGEGGLRGWVERSEVIKDT